MFNNYIYIIISIVSLLDCSNREQANDMGTPQCITFIFKNYPKYENEIQLGKGIFYTSEESNIEILENKIRNNDSVRPRMGKVDTLTISTSNQYLFFSHKYNFFYSKACVLKQGDTIEISYLDKIPHFKILNRVCEKYETSFDSLLNVVVNNNQKYSNLNYYMMPELKYSHINQMNIFEMYKNKEKYGLAAINDLKKSTQLVNELFPKGEISKELRDLLIDKYSFQDLQIKSALGLLSQTQENKIIDSLKTAEINIPYSFIESFYTEIAKKRFESKAKTIKIGNNQTIDYRLVYDNVKQSQIFNTNYKSHILYKYLLSISKNFSSKDISKYANDFLKNSDNSFFNEKIRNSFIVESNLVSSIDSLYLLHDSKKVLTLQKLLQINKGRIVYIDFWASWCKPCRQEMPFSLKIRKNYTDDKIVFIFLSLDENIESWKKASKTEGLENYNYSYMLINFDKSDFIRKNNVSSIPRYMIINQEGKIEYADAPRPSDPKLKEIFNELLKQN